MKKTAICGVLATAVALMSTGSTRAQGNLTYLSNLEQPSAGSRAVGSDSWLAMRFITGTNAGGYSLDSIQLAMADALGSPSGFSAMVYTQGFVVVGGILPGSSIGALSGSLSPVTGGIYTYTAVSSITLAPRTPYFLVLTAATLAASGAYEWSYAGADFYNPNGGWAVTQGAAAGFYASADGSSWNSIPFAFPQFGLNASAVPEPGTWGLLLTAACLLCLRRRR